jgi:hypothetical protein
MGDTLAKLVRVDVMQSSTDRQDVGTGWNFGCNILILLNYFQNMARLQFTMTRQIREDCVSIL